MMKEIMGGDISWKANRRIMHRHRRAVPGSEKFNELYCHCVRLLSDEH